MYSLREIWIRTLEIILRKQLLTYKIRIGGRLCYFLPGNIIKVQADGAYSKLFTTHGTYHISRNIAQIETLLNGWGMVRVNRSFIINVVHIEELEVGPQTYILMSDKSIIELPKKKQEKLVRKFERLKF